MGLRVTGVNSSQKMLQEAQRQASSCVISLKQGDITQLPCTSNAFDSAIALNVLRDVPNWREVLRHWKNSVRCGGKIIFNMHSQDHVIAAYGKNKVTWPKALATTVPPDQAHDNSRLTLAELHQFANEAEMTITAVIPYFAFCGANRLIDKHIGHKNRWLRMLSWFSRDENLFLLGLFLEEQLLAHLTPRMSDHLFIVLTNQPNKEANAHFVQRIADIDTALKQHSFSGLLPYLPLSLEAYRTNLSQFLQPLRARGFF